MKKAKNLKLIIVALLSITIFLGMLVKTYIRKQNIQLANISNDIPLQATENYAWTQDKTNVTNGEITLEVGSKITGYEANGVSDWYVLGAESGRLLLTTNVNTEVITLTNIKSNINGVSTLNSAATAYKNSTLASSARSMKVEDVNRITGYSTSVNAVDYGKNSYYWYGNAITYTIGSYTNSAGISCNLKMTGTKYPTTEAYYKTFNSNAFYYPSSSTSLGTMSSGSKTFTSTLYSYYPQTLSTTSSTETSINGSELAYNLLFLNTSGNNSSSTTNCYWLANNYIKTNYGSISWRSFWSIKWHD